MGEMDWTLPDSASAFRPVRPIGDRLRAYTVAEGSWRLLNHTLRMAHACGFVEPATRDSYALLDVLDDGNDIVAGYGVPHARAWRWWYRKLGCRIDRELTEI